MDKLGLDASPSELNALLWQTGYLSIKKKDETDYLLGFPNREVKTAFLNVLWQRYSAEAQENDITARLRAIRQGLRAGDLEAFFTHFSQLMATIPYQLFVKKEAYYHTLIYLVMELSGLRPANEISVASGRVDTVLQVPDTTYVFEFKIDADAATALAQIKAKGYHTPYLNQSKRVVLVGVAFDTATRSLKEWQQEAL